MTGLEENRRASLAMPNTGQIAIDNKK